MNYIDYILIVIVLIGFLLGFKDGLIRKIIGLIGLIAGIALALGKIAPEGSTVYYIALILGVVLGSADAMKILKSQKLTQLNGKKTLIGNTMLLTSQGSNFFHWGIFLFILGGLMYVIGVGHKIKKGEIKLRKK